jgi:hypothetical protein
MAERLFNVGQYVGSVENVIMKAIVKELNG